MWVKIDDGMPHHPKVVAAGPQAFALDVAGIAYSNRFRTRGFIADGALAAVLPGLTQARRHAKKLAEVGRWERDDAQGGYLIHDIHDYQPTPEEATERDQERSEKGVLANHKRWHEGRDVVSSDCPHCVPTASPQASQTHPNGDTSGNPTGIPKRPPSRPDKTEPEDQDLYGVANEDERVSDVAPPDASSNGDVPQPKPQVRSDEIPHISETFGGIR